MKNDSTLKLIVAGCLLGIILLVGPHACTQSDKTTKLLEQQGYKNIVITGWRPMMASDSDSFSTGFEATAPNGEKVSGAVTGGFMKGATIRFD